MRHFWILRGLPASGKSTFARELLKKEPDRFKRINRDDLRGMLDDHRWSKENEDFVRLVQNDIIKNAILDGYDVLVDNTNLVKQTVHKLHQLAESIGDIKVIEKAFNVPVSECLRRNSLREGSARVPDKVIHDMASAAGISRGKSLHDAEVYYPPKSVEPIVQDQKLPRAVICDLDGTLALIGDRSPYDASRCDEVDEPNWPVIECLRAMHAQGCKVIFVSGREDKHRPQTIRFIEKHLHDSISPLQENGPVPAVDLGTIPYELHMRSSGDMRKDSIIKRELFDANIRDKFNVLFVLDDRNQVVEFWRSIGLTCFQVARGDF